MAKPLTDSDLVQVDQGFGGRLAVDEIRRLREANEGLRAKCAALERVREVAEDRFSGACQELDEALAACKGKP